MVTPVPFPLSDVDEDPALRYHTESSRAGIRAVRRLDDELLVQTARSGGPDRRPLDPPTPGYVTVLRAIGSPETNPLWIAHACAEEAYLRGVISEREFDCLVD